MLRDHMATSAHAFRKIALSPRCLPTGARLRGDGHSTRQAGYILRYPTLTGKVPGAGTFHYRAGFVLADFGEVVAAAVPGLFDEGRGELPDVAVLAEVWPVHLIARAALASNRAGADDRERHVLLRRGDLVSRLAHGPVRYDGRDIRVKILVTALADRRCPVAVHCRDLPDIPVPATAGACIGHRRVGQLVELEATAARLRTHDTIP